MARIQQHQQHETIPLSWGTLEELLLACAVNRHGTKSWDSIAMEVQNRTSTFSSLTSQNCRDKFTDLKRRFVSQNGVVSSIVDQLRKIRVEELRREVQQRDVSIVSLELKVKRLEEERERSIKEEADLITEEKVSPDTFAGKSAGGNNDSGDELDNRSFNESNSTSQQKAETTTLRLQNDVVKIEENINVKIDSENRNERDPDTIPDPGDEKDWSHNDGDNNNRKKIKANTAVKKKNEMKLSPATGGLGGESNEVGESVGESKREDKEKEKQNNSDVQSSVSLSQYKNKKRRRGDGGGGDRGLVVSSSGEEPDGGYEVSPATKNMPAVKSEPLVKLISIIRSHQLGFTFERRLRSQESGRYKKLIRQHMDLQTIQSRLDKGTYSSCLHKFFRDLLLLFNNAIVFFGKNSPENLAACELRSLVFKEMTDKLRTQPKPRTILPVKPEPKQQPVSFSKPNKSSSTIVVCGKGNSVKATSENAAKKGNKREKEVEEKTEAKEKKIEEKGIKKKRTKDGSGSGSGSVSGHRNNNSSNKNREIKHRYGGNELSSHDALEMKNGKNGSGVRKKQGAASFLKRIKQNSPSRATENDDDDDNDDDSLEEESKRGRDEKTARVTRSWRGRGAREDSKGKGKRGIGRPPKEVVVESGKRGRENNGGGGGDRARKRSRR
ncbi:uncharacterized protein LOC126673557 [Mercurialis annua]|uniref:uncharacterized protein LOC126673557 n=1 Tax=Mercurialis annua TaxID=3986 RepID=UPI00215E1425|nr:uncharacterized protein LOC126673557 [Mercurialis annua]